MNGFLLSGLNTLNDRPGGRNRDRLKPLLPIVTRNRRNLSHIVSLPPPERIEDQQRQDQQKVVTPRQRSPSPPPSPSPRPSPLPSPPSPPREPKLQKKRDNSKVPDKDHSKLISAIEVFTETLVAKCLSKNVSEKLEAIGEFKSLVESYNKENNKPGKFFKASSELLLFLLDSSIWNAFKSACEITESLFDKVVEKYK